MRILKNAWFVKYAKREKISDELLKKAIDEANTGIIAADLGGCVIKQRIARKGSGKSGGYRTIIAFKQNDKAFFMYGFSKKRQDNIEPDELIEFKKAAKELLALSDEQIQKLLDNGLLAEVDSE
jgi:hypothetical protein